MPTRREKLTTAFHAFDADGNGVLDKEELRKILARPGTGKTMSDLDIDELMDIFDDDGDGNLNISEFIDLMDGIGDATKGDSDDDDDDDKPPPGWDDDSENAAENPAAAEESVADDPSAVPLAASTADWVEFELGVDLDQCKALAPFGTDIDHPMITGPETSFVLTMEEADEFCKPELAPAIADFKDTYSGVINVRREALSDGYLFTAQNEGSAGAVYWMKCRRFLSSKAKPDGVAYAIESTCSIPSQLEAAVAFAKSVRAPRDDELL